MKRKIYTMLLSIFLMSMFITTTVYASPGGIIAKEVARSPLGKLFFAIITILLLPYLIYSAIKKRISISRTQKILYQLSRLNNNFSWSILNERSHAIITHVYSAWKKTDIEVAKEWMTSWYWQNQKITVLENWEEDGLQNICKLHKIRSVKPLHIEYREKEKGDGEGSRIALNVTVVLTDYLINKDTEKVVEGDKQKKELENVWTIILTDGQWKLSLIEDSSEALSYAKLKSDVELANKYIGESSLNNSRSSID